MKSIKLTRPPKPISEVWWCGINPHGVPVWRYLDGLKKHVAELLDTHEHGWKSQGWRIAKLRVTEIPQSHSLLTESQRRAYSRNSPIVASDHYNQKLSVRSWLVRSLRGEKKRDERLLWIHGPTMSGKTHLTHQLFPKDTKHLRLTGGFLSPDSLSALSHHRQPIVIDEFRRSPEMDAALRILALASPQPIVVCSESHPNPRLIARIALVISLHAPRKS